MADSEDGWVTIEGVHVFVEGGVITKGPSALIGHSPHASSPVSDHAASIIDQYASPATGSRDGEYEKVRNEGAKWAEGGKSKGWQDLYNETQTRLKKQGVSEVKAFRGVSLSADHPLAKAILSGTLKPGDSFNAEGMSLTSWSQSSSQAQRFAKGSPSDLNSTGKRSTVGVVFERAIPASDVVASHSTHTGFLPGEREVIAKNKGAAKLRILAIHHAGGSLSLSSSQLTYDLSPFDDQRGIGEHHHEKGKDSMQLSAVILRAPGLSAAREMPMALAGYPSNIDGQPVSYKMKEVAKVGNYTHPGSGQSYEITPDRMDKWVQNFRGMSDNGIKCHIPTVHRGYDAKDNMGFVVGLERQGQSLMALTQLIGEDAAKFAARNDVSIYVTRNARDAKGNVYDEALEHLALVPNPAQPNLSGFVSIAASAGPAIETPVLILAAPSIERSIPMLSPEQLQTARDILGAADLTEETAVPKLIEWAKENKPKLALSATVPTLTTERDALKVERDGLKTELDSAKTLALSANKPAPDATTLSLVARSLKTERAAAIAAGGVTPAVADKLDALMLDKGTPNALALSATSEGEPLAFRLYGILAENKPVKTGEQTASQSLALSREVPGDTKPKDASADDIMARAKAVSPHMAAAK